jgi:hypothetical protein
MENLYSKTPNKVFGPIYVPTEQYAFYINFDTPVSDSNFDHFQLDVYQGATSKATNIGPLQKDLVTGITYNIFAVFHCPQLPNGYYQFVIWDTLANVEKIRSNYIWIENDPLAYANAPTVLYRNASNRNKINYENLVDYFNVFRLPLIKIDYQFELQKTQYRNASDQRLRNLRDFKYKFIKIESYWFDEPAHEAASEMYEHDGIYIDGIKYITKDAYSIATEPLNDYSKGSVNMYVDDTDQEYTFPINTRSVFVDSSSPEAMAQKTVIDITDGSVKVINWQTDYLSGTTITYVAKHGNSIQISESDLTNGVWVPNGVPAAAVAKDGSGNILTVTLSPQSDISEFIII